jgi:uncharacterized RDD family membrane protein YckC
MTNDENWVYAGFWIRVWASIIDTILLGLIALPILISIYGTDYFESESLIQGSADFLLSYVFPAIAVIVFWIYKSATPGKMAVSAKVVDARTGEAPSPAQCIGRYFAYFVSILPLGLGLIWVTFDKKKQGWHDKLAGTVVVRRKTEPVMFTN